MITDTKYPELEIISKCVNDAAGVNIFFRCNKQRYVRARWIYFNLCKEFTGYNLSEIARHLNMDHSSASHGLKHFERDIWGDVYWREIYAKALSALGVKNREGTSKNKLAHLLDDYNDLQRKYKALKEQIHRVDSEAKPLLDIFKKLSPEYKKRLLFQARNLDKMSQIMEKTVA